MGFLSSFFDEVLDDALGFDPPKARAPAPAPQPAVATTSPATNTPGQAPAQTSFDRVQSYLALQSQKAFNEQLKQISARRPSVEPPTFAQTEQGQKVIKFGIIALIAWLFLFKGKL
jgi:hypothetical protein